MWSRFPPASPFGPTAVCPGSRGTARLRKSPWKGLWAVVGGGGFAQSRGSPGAPGGPVELSPPCSGAGGSGSPQPPGSPHQWLPLLMDNCNWISKLHRLRLDSISLFSGQTTP